MFTLVSLFDINTSNNEILGLNESLYREDESLFFFIYYFTKPQYHRLFPTNKLTNLRILSLYIISIDFMTTSKKKMIVLNITGHTARTDLTPK